MQRILACVRPFSPLESTQPIPTCRRHRFKAIAHPPVSPQLQYVIESLHHIEDFVIIGCWGAKLTRVVSDKLFPVCTLQPQLEAINKGPGDDQCFNMYNAALFIYALCSVVMFPDALAAKQS
jgi:hypothetical protein